MQRPDSAEPQDVGRRGALRRHLGTVEAYAALIGILVGAGIFRVTTEAARATGPSVILGYLVLAPIILASAVPYMAFLSTPLGLQPGGEYAHIRRSLRSDRLAFLCAWLKIIAYVGAGAYLAGALADYLIEMARLLGADLDPELWRKPVAFGGLTLFYLIHTSGIRWFGRLQVAMCAVLGLSIVVLVVPGLFAVEAKNYRPFFTAGAAGFAAALPPLLFSFAGFESLAQIAGEMKDGPRRLPRIFAKGIAITTVLFVAISVVAFGVLPASRLAASSAPMAEAAAQYLPFGPTALVITGAVMAVATSLNATMLVPVRLAWTLARDGLLPPWPGALHAGSGVPRLGLTATWMAMALLLWSGQVSLMLTSAVMALVLLYLLHSVALLLLPRSDPDLFRQIRIRIPWRWQVAAAWVSVLGMAAVSIYQFGMDARHMLATSLASRWSGGSLTSLELLVAWGLIGAGLYTLRPKAPE